MEFKLWLEHAPIDRVIEQTIKTFQLSIPGQWMASHAQEKMPSWWLQKFYSMTLLGRGVRLPTDLFKVGIHAYVHKHTESIRRTNFKNIPAWADDPSQWQGPDQYDVRQGHPLLEFYVHVSGSKHVQGNPLQLATKIAHSYLLFGKEQPDDLGNNYGLKVKIGTPYQVVQFVKERINKYYDDNEDDSETPPVPTGGQLVGV